MKFDELDQKMRVYETNSDYHVLPNVFMVARVDGRSFTRLTKEVHAFEAPYDPVFRDYMIETTKHLMKCGFNVVYGYTQSDEISLLLHPKEDVFHRKTRKFNSVLAGEASAKFSVLLGDVASFDCRVSELPTIELVVDYFRWRNEDAHRNALNAHCYWTLRKEGLEPHEAERALRGKSVSYKNEFLFERGTNFNDLPPWQKRGIGIHWQEYEKSSLNPKTNEPAIAIRRRLQVNDALPMKELYSQFIRSLLTYIIDQ